MCFGGIIPSLGETPSASILSWLASFWQETVAAIRAAAQKKYLVCMGRTVLKVIIISDILYSARKRIAADALLHPDRDDPDLRSLILPVSL